MENSDNPIAMWLYEMYPDRMGKRNIPSLDLYREWLKIVCRCSDVLRDNDILLVSEIVLKLVVCISDSGELKTVPITNKSIEIENGCGENLFRILMEMVTSNSNPNEITIPAIFELYGWTEVNAMDEKLAKVERIAYVEGEYLDEGRFSVYISSDIWLPFSFDGTSRNENCDSMAIRLGKAMSTIEEIIGHEPVFDKVTDYCYVEAYKVSNLLDGNDNVIAIDSRGGYL